MIDGRYKMIETPGEVFMELFRGAELMGVLFRASDPFDEGIYEVSELEVWQLQEMLTRPDFAVFRITSPDKLTRIRP